jgi:hypothetical protein
MTTSSAQITVESPPRVCLFLGSARDPVLLEQADAERLLYDLHSVVMTLRGVQKRPLRKRLFARLAG